jgi:3-phenylpropionate/cinnamic acid dioxygenase small subunit
MLSLQELSDRAEIQDLLIDYSTAIDRRDYEALDKVFTHDAYVDLFEGGGIAGSYPEVRAWLKLAMAPFPFSQHLLGNMSIKLSGDKATCRTACINPMIIKLDNGAMHTMFIGHWYNDELVRTDTGWRIARRTIEACYRHNVPDIKWDIPKISADGAVSYDEIPMATVYPRQA